MAKIQPDNIKDCCFDCGKKRYNAEILQDGITIHEGVCPFCNKKKALIPASDWLGKGD